MGSEREGRRAESKKSHPVSTGPNNAFPKRQPTGLTAQTDGQQLMGNFSVRPSALYLGSVHLLAENAWGLCELNRTAVLLRAKVSALPSTVLSTLSLTAATTRTQNCSVAVVAHALPTPARVRNATEREEFSVGSV